MSRKIQSFLMVRYPEVKDMFRLVGVIPKLKPRPMPLSEAVVRVVVGQMLSSVVARTIYSRLQDAAKRRELSGTWELTGSDLRACGLSRAKTQTILGFATALRENPRLLDDWHTLPPGELTSRIKSFWGMSDWTASILALFYVGHEDVFPKSDGSLLRAIELLKRRSRRRKFQFDPNAATPYRSYLAMYLWRALDGGFIGGAKRA